MYRQYFSICQRMRIATTIEKFVPTTWKVSGSLQTFKHSYQQAVLRVNASDMQADSSPNNSFFYFIHPFDEWIESDTSCFRELTPPQDKRAAQVSTRKATLRSNWCFWSSGGGD